MLVLVVATTPAIVHRVWCAADQIVFSHVQTEHVLRVLNHPTVQKVHLNALLIPAVVVRMEDHAAPTIQRILVVLPVPVAAITSAVHLQNAAMDCAVQMMMTLAAQMRKEIRCAVQRELFVVALVAVQ